MSKKYIALIIVLLLLPAFLMTGCSPASGGGNNGVVPIIVIFDAQGGAVSPASKEVTAGSTYGELPVPTKPDSTFLGWFTEKAGGTEVTSSTKVTNTKSHTLYAHWAFVVTVTFDPQGGVVSPASKEVTVGSTYGELPVPIKTNFVFVGWFTEKTGENILNIVISSTKVNNTKSHTLYAHWARIVIVTFDPQGGTVGLKTKLAAVGYEYGLLDGELPTPKPPKPAPFPYKFIGWFTEPDMGELVTSSTIVTIDHDHTLYAHWKNLFL